MFKRLITALLAISVFTLSACGLAGARSADFTQSAAPPEPFGIAVEGERATFEGGAFEAPSDDASNVSQFVAEERLVIRNANLTIVVPDPVESVEEIRKMAEQLGGFVVYSNVYQTTFGEAQVKADQASITIRVPAERLVEALALIKESATEVRNENVSGQDVTQEYTDLQSRLRNQEAAEARLLEIMGSAVKTEDVLAVFDTLTRIQEQIEIIKGRIQYLEQSSALSAISVELIPDVANQPLQIGRWQPQGTAKAAVESLIEALQWLADTAIWAAICVLPMALIVGLPLYFAIRAIIRRRQAARKSKAATE